MCFGGEGASGMGRHHDRRVSPTPQGPQLDRAGVPSPVAGLLGVAGVAVAGVIAGIRQTRLDQRPTAIDTVG